MEEILSKIKEEIEKRVPYLKNYEEKELTGDKGKTHWYTTTKYFKDIHGFIPKKDGGDNFKIKFMELNSEAYVGFERTGDMGGFLKVQITNNARIGLKESMSGERYKDVFRKSVIEGTIQGFDYEEKIRINELTQEKLNKIIDSINKVLYQLDTYTSEYLNVQFP